ncbi:hypothetical protein E6O75_ATG03044 [Venturia nashicola]|uniref:Uncharacterized protein n=1 Tax=Venturia nashicola TaxID=86259 RepID=A0A4Z1P6M7_9PEZI|nr:hypothetical protein E6O75_ATG03044 [Venturia nashicola]
MVASGLWGNLRGSCGGIVLVCGSSRPGQLELLGTSVQDEDVCLSSIAERHLRLAAESGTETTSAKSGLDEDLYQVGCTAGRITTTGGDIDVAVVWRMQSGACSLAHVFWQGSEL